MFLPVGSVFWPDQDPDPDPLQETLIWIRVAKKIVINSHKNQPIFLKKKSLILFNILEDKLDHKLQKKNCFEFYNFNRKK